MKVLINNKFGTISFENVSEIQFKYTLWYLFSSYLLWWLLEMARLYQFQNLLNEALIIFNLTTTTKVMNY